MKGRNIGRRRIAAVALVMAAVGIAGCGDDPAGVDVEFEVIEETTFAASLGVDLEAMTETTTGVYWENLVAGSGEAAVFGTTPTVTYTLWLTDGSEIESGTFSFLMGNNRVIAGFEEGLLNTLEGGTRRIIIPPNRGYGAQSQIDEFGNVTVPGGSVLVFEVTVDAVATP